MKQFFRIRQGEGGRYLKQAVAEGFLGADYGVRVDLSQRLPSEWRAFNREFIPVYLASHPGKSRIAAGLAMGALWTVCKGIHQGAVVLSPASDGTCRVAEVIGEYAYVPGPVLPHRRNARWSERIVRKDEMSDGLSASVFGRGTQCNLSGHESEIVGLIQPGVVSEPISAPSVAPEDPVAFAMERHLEDFLVDNWAMTDLGRDYDIYPEEDGESGGRQFPTDDGRMDILAISKDKKTLLVVELKRGRASDVVVGQTLRYMGYAQEVLAESNQQVRGVIIAFDNDLRLKRAISAAGNIDFFRYHVSFRLERA